MAAPQTPILRICVNAVLGGARALISAVKVGNATLTQALDDSARDLSDSDGLATPWGDVISLPEGARTAARKDGGEATNGQRSSVTNQHSHIPVRTQERPK